MSYELTDRQRRAALTLAERTVVHGLEHGDLPAVDNDFAELFPDQERASFVTLKLDGELNGCMGCLRPTRLLHHGIAHNAFRAAFKDPRLPAVTSDDLEALTVHISVLEPLEPVPAESDDEIWEFVTPGRHGLVLVAGQSHGTFLPSVWEKCPDPQTFLAQLKHKAGIPPASWPSDMKIFRYTVDEFDRQMLA